MPTRKKRLLNGGFGKLTVQSVKIVRVPQMTGDTPVHNGMGCLSRTQQTVEIAAEAEMMPP